MDRRHLVSTGLPVILATKNVSSVSQDVDIVARKELHGVLLTELPSTADAALAREPVIGTPTHQPSSHGLTAPATHHERHDLLNDAPAGQRLLFLDCDGVLHPLRIRLLHGSQQVDTSHCFQPSCMEQVKRVIEATGAKLVLSSSWRLYEHARERVASALAEYGLGFVEWTTSAGGETPTARVDQILAFVSRASNVLSWATVDDDDLAPCTTAGSESMMHAVFRQNFVRTDAETGLTFEKADMLINVLLGTDDSEEDSDPDGSSDTSPAMLISKRCLSGFSSVGWAIPKSIQTVSSRLVQHLWSKLGSITELAVGAGDSTHLIIMKSISPPADPKDDDEQWRDYKSYLVESRFYDQGHAAEACHRGACCPLPLLVDCTEEGQICICMTRVPGFSCAGGAGKPQVLATLTWLAKFHAMYWGHDRADKAVRSGLHRQGCYWNLDARSLELARTSLEGLEGRLRLAAVAVDARLKRDALQTICHGDPKDANIIDAEDGSIALCDFQWVGKAPPTKDLAYCLVCGAESLTAEDEETYLRHYFDVLSSLLSSQGDDVPNLEDFRDSYSLSMCDLARWMAGWGWWGHVRVVKAHAMAVLEKLDGGEMLSSAEEYREKMTAAFPGPVEISPDANLDTAAHSTSVSADLDILKFSATQVDEYFESKLALQPGASDVTISKRMSEMDLDDLEALQGDAVDISKGGFDWDAKVQAQVWEVRFANFIA